jgi:NlpC/P60 family putative phage cell wall peptidase
MTGAEVVAAARGWIGTPYRHQASLRGSGCDCLGLVRGVWRELYGEEPETLPPYSADWGESQGEEVLWQAALRHLRMRAGNDTGAEGDLLLFRMRSGSVAKHLGVAARRPEGPTFVHAMSGRGVIESALSEPWARRVVARFVFPDTDTKG